MDRVVITQDMINNAGVDEIFASGLFENSPEGMYLSNNPNARKVVKWVAVRGVIADWSVYCESLFTNEFYIEDISGHWHSEAIAEYGDKIYSRLIPKFIDCDDEALKSYRD